MKQKIENIKIEKSDIYVTKSIIAKDGKRNRGVFANKSFKIGQIIEINPIIWLSDYDYEIISNTELGNYPFRFAENESCIVLGFGEIYNHLENANIHWYDDIKNNIKIFYALKDIEKDEELFYNYNGLNVKDNRNIEQEYDY